MTSGRVLIVEDDSLVRSTMERVCTWLGLEAELACDGLAGLARLDDGSFDLVLTDLRMPGASGLEVARRALGRGSPPAVIVVSGFATPDEEAAIEALGAAFLRKPFEIARARAVIEAALGGA